MRNQEEKFDLGWIFFREKKFQSKICFFCASFDFELVVSAK